MEKKNYNIEIFFESQKKSFVILSKNKITLEEVKTRTMKEFDIQPEFEKDMRFSIILNNRLITILNDYQIMKNFEEMSKNNFYLKINFNVINNNYIYHSLSSNSINKIKIKNKKQKIEKKEQFSIIAQIPIKSGDNKYIEEIKKLKEEIEKLKSEKNNKPEFDIRKFDEKIRDLNNKNNDLEQKIIELENENKTLKINLSKNILEDDNLDNLNKKDDNILINQIEKIFKKIIKEHDNNIKKEISDIKDKMDSFINGKNIINNDNKDKINKINNNNDNNFELLNDNKEDKNEIDKSLPILKDEEDNNDDINKIVDIFDGLNEKNDINKINKEQEEQFINLDVSENNIDNSKNIENIIHENKTINSIRQKNINDSDIENKKEDNTYINPKIKRNINFYEEDENEKNSKSFDNSSKLKANMRLNKKDKSTFKEIKNNFLENNKNIPIYLFEKSKKNNNPKYTKYIIPNKLKTQDKNKDKLKKQEMIFNSYNNNNFNSKKQPSLSEEDIINYESCSEFNSELNTARYKKINGNKLLKKEKIRNINKINYYTINNNNETPSPGMKTVENKKNSYINKAIKYENYITPNPDESNIKENIENYFINVFQNIFFYGNNGYINMLNISEKLIKKIKDGLFTYRNNMKEIKDSSLRYISYTIVPIINDINTKDYQRKILKEKIKKILEYLKIDSNYFEKEYKISKDNKNEKNSEERNINKINITYSKIKEFRKDYELNEKDYPDEMLIKALMRYRGNKEMAFQYLFYK